MDPYFQRTVIVASKFDNRLKEFQERWEVDKYLSVRPRAPRPPLSHLNLPLCHVTSCCGPAHHACVSRHGGAFHTQRASPAGCPQATGYLPSNVRPFFVALPKDRVIQSSAGAPGCRAVGRARAGSAVQRRATAVAAALLVAWPEGCVPL